MKIYYDGDCPFCDNYVSLLKLKDTVGDVKLINLRESKKDKDRLLKKGLTLIKDGCATGTKLFQGAQAVQNWHVFRQQGPFNKINKFIFFIIMHQ